MDDDTKVLENETKGSTPMLESVDDDGGGGVRFTHDSDVEFARAALEVMEGEGPNFVFDRGQFWRFVEGTGIWRPVPVEDIQATICEFDAEYVMSGVDKNGDPKISKLKVRHGMLVGCASTAAILRRAPGFFNEAPEGLAFANGFIRVSADGDLQMEPLTPAHRVRSVLPVAVDLDALAPEMFVAFLNDVFEGATDKEDRIRAVREFLGAALAGVATVYQRMLLLLGEGRNGKSVVQGVIEACFPAEAKTSVGPASLSSEYSRADLARSRLNTMAELPDTHIQESETFKAMVTGGLIHARQIREAPFDFQYRGAMVGSANALPAPHDISDGFFRRFLIVPFERRYSGDGEIVDLANKLVQLELPQILVWGLRGAADLIRRGHYLIPPSSTEINEQWQLDSDQVRRFVHEACEVAPIDTKSPTADASYKEYRKWAEANGHQPVSSTKFGRRVKALGVAWQKTAHAMVYGLHLRNVGPAGLRLG